MPSKWNIFLTRLTKWTLPWIAIFLTMLPYHQRLSHFLDRLIILAEREK